jgi:spore maturation protein CgeB
VPDGIAISEWITSHARGITAFYDIDTPVTLAGLEKGLDYLSPRTIPRFDLYLSFSGGPVPGMIECAYGSPLARALYCSADMRLYQPQQVESKWSLGYLGTYSDDRQSSLNELLLAPARELKASAFVVAGAQYPDRVDWPTNVDRIEHLAPGKHAEFYSRQRFTLNVTRADMRSLGFSPSVRLFEAAACGAPIISDRWPGIETIFSPSSEILLVNYGTEVVNILREMPEQRRLSLADKARKRILADHTPGHRARQLEAYYLEATSRRARIPIRRAVAQSVRVAEA